MGVMLMPTVATVPMALLLLLLAMPAAGVDTRGCQASCTANNNCTDGALFYNPCALCDTRRGECVPVCGAGCRSDVDCRLGGGGNPCTTCDLSTRTCVNPQPLCGSFCGGQASACLVNGSADHCASSPGIAKCCVCPDDWTIGCSGNAPPPSPPGPPKCGKGVLC